MPTEDFTLPEPFALFVGTKKDLSKPTEIFGLLLAAEAPPTKCYLYTEEQLRAASTHQSLGTQGGWMPIETAHVSGPVLLWWRTARTPLRGQFICDERGEGWMNDGDQVLPRNQSDCILWQPLPANPKDQP